MGKDNFWMTELQTMYDSGIVAGKRTFVRTVGFYSVYGVEVQMSMQI